MIQVVSLGGKQLLGVLLGAAKGGNTRQGENFLRLVPCLEGQEHIGSHQEPQLVLRVLFPQGLQGVGGKASPRPAQFQVQHLHPAIQAGLIRRQACHRQPLLRSGRTGGQVLVRRQSRRNQQQLIQFQQLKHRPGRRDMAQMGRVEGTAVNADLHGIPSFQMVFFLDSRVFTSWMRLSLGLLWVSRYSTNLVPMT